MMKLQTRKETAADANNQAPPLCTIDSGRRFFSSRPPFFRHRGGTRTTVERAGVFAEKAVFVMCRQTVAHDLLFGHTAVCASVATEDLLNLFFSLSKCQI